MYIKTEINVCIYVKSWLISSFNVLSFKAGEKLKKPECNETKLRNQSMNRSHVWHFKSLIEIRTSCNVINIILHYLVTSDNSCLTFNTRKKGCNILWIVELPFFNEEHLRKNKNNAEELQKLDNFVQPKCKTKY